MRGNGCSLQNCKHVHLSTTHRGMNVCMCALQILSLGSNASVKSGCARSLAVCMLFTLFKGHEKDKTNRKVDKSFKIASQPCISHFSPIMMHKRRARHGILSFTPYGDARHYQIPYLSISWCRTRITGVKFAIIIPASASRCTYATSSASAALEFSVALNSGRKLVLVAVTTTVSVIVSAILTVVFSLVAASVLLDE